MAGLSIRLRCTRCRAYTDFEPVSDTQAVRCETCGKRHSRDSLYAVEPGETPDFED